MSRRRKDPNQRTRTITLTIDDDTAVLLEQYMFHFGIESKQATILVLLHAAMGAIPVNSAAFELLKQIGRQTRQLEYEALALHFEQRSHLMRQGP